MLKRIGGSSYVICDEHTVTTWGGEKMGHSAAAWQRCEVFSLGVKCYIYVRNISFH